MNLLLGVRSLLILCLLILFGQYKTTSMTLIETSQKINSEFFDEDDEFANQLLSRTFEHKQKEIEIIDKTVKVLNDTVEQLRCPKKWSRLGRSCYYTDGVMHSEHSVALESCIRHSQKPAASQNRISLTRISSPMEIHSIAGLMAQMNISRVMIRMDSILAETVHLLRNNIDNLFMNTLENNPITSRLRFCQTVNVFNLKPEDHLYENSNPTINQQEVIKKMYFLINKSKMNSYNINKDKLLILNNSHVFDNDQCFLLDFVPSSDNDLSSSQGFFDQFDARFSSGRCSLIYNSDCKCPDGCNYLCKYTTDLCVLNPICGPNGRCVDSVRGGIKCECNFLYDDGSLCSKVSREGIQIIVCTVIVILISLGHSWILRHFIGKIFSIPFKIILALISICNPGIKNNRFYTSQFKSLHSWKKFALQETILNRSRVSFNRRFNQFNRRKTVPPIGKQRMPSLPVRARSSGQPNISLNNNLNKTKIYKNRNSLSNNFRNLFVATITLFVTAFVLISSSLTQLMVFKSDFSSESRLRTQLNDSLSIVKKCQVLTSFAQENLISFPFAIAVILVFVFYTKNEEKKRRHCCPVPSFPIPIEPFKTKNRFTTAVIFGLLACEVLKIFEELLFKTSSQQAMGILLDLSVRVGFVFLIGMRYYPHLASLQLRRYLVCTGIACAYAWFDMIYVVIKQGFCMGFVPISTVTGLVNEARLRLELGSWYVVYGIFRNIPHFACLAYIASEFTTRFLESLRDNGYMAFSNNTGNNDSKSPLVDDDYKLYEQDIRGYKTKREIPLVPNRSVRARVPDSYASCWDGNVNNATGLVVAIHHTKDDEDFFSLAFTDSAPNHLYVRNLFRKSRCLKNNLTKDMLQQRLTDRHTQLQQNPIKRSYNDDYSLSDDSEKSFFKRFLKRLFHKIYKWRSDFRFSSIAVCTFVTAIIFLYYLACTLAFYHLSRTEGHGFVLDFYFRQILSIVPVASASDQLKNLEYSVGNGFTFWREVCCAGVLSYFIFVVQIFHSIKQYRYNKLMMYKGIFEDVPSARHLNPSKMIAQSVHYSGFLIGYMAWGFIIVFYVILLFCCTLSVFFRQQIKPVTTAISFLVPVSVIYALKLLLVRSTSKAVFTQDFGSKMALNNRRAHAIFVYFNFFFDCFLGVVACLSRLIKSILLNILFMARLDYSFVGRPLERLDPGFSTYVAFLHTEVAHTHPVLVAFCDVIWRQIVLRRIGLISNSRVGSNNKHNTYFSSKGVIVLRSYNREHARFRWMLAYTLLRNAGILSFRKNLSSRLQLIFAHRMLDIGYDCSNPYIANNTQIRQHAAAPSIRVYNTTGEGHLLSSAGEAKTNEDKKLSRNYNLLDSQSSNNDSQNEIIDDELEDEDTIPLILETAVCPSNAPAGTMSLLHYLQCTKKRCYSSVNSDGRAYNPIGRHSLNEANNEESLDDSPTVLRIASYSERDALWRQGVRERVYNKSRYRYHYGCLNRLPAVKLKELANYYHISSNRLLSTDDTNELFEQQQQQQQQRDSSLSTLKCTFNASDSMSCDNQKDDFKEKTYNSRSKSSLYSTNQKQSVDEQYSSNSAKNDNYNSNSKSPSTRHRCNDSSAIYGTICSDNTISLGHHQDYQLSSSLIQPYDHLSKLRSNFDSVSSSSDYNYQHNKSTLLANNDEDQSIDKQYSSASAHNVQIHSSMSTPNLIRQNNRFRRLYDAHQEIHSSDEMKYEPSNIYHHYRSNNNHYRQ